MRKFVELSRFKRSKRRFTGRFTISGSQVLRGIAHQLVLARRSYAATNPVVIPVAVTGCRFFTNGPDTDDRRNLQRDHPRVKFTTEARGEARKQASAPTTCSRNFRRTALPSVKRLSQQRLLSDRWSTHSNPTPVMHIFSCKHFHSAYTQYPRVF